MNSGVGDLAEEAETRLERSNELLNETKVFTAPVSNMTDALNAVRSRIQTFNERLDDLNNHSGSARAKAMEAGALNAKNR